MILLLFTTRVAYILYFPIARALLGLHPTGEPIEAYILTSTNGARRLRERAMLIPHLKSRINDILIELSDGDPDAVALEKLPKLLYDKYKMRIVQHDGGQRLLRLFCQAGVLPQINLTLCRKQSLYDIIASHKALSAETIESALKHFNERNKMFFTNVVLPSTLIPVSLITDRDEDVAVVTFDARHCTDF